MSARALVGGDDRGRVPFALVGVVLLLGSVVYANTAAVGGPVAVDTAADDALERAESAGRPAVRSAATAAAHEAARSPVTTPANTTVGRALDPDHPFRDALRLRIGLAVDAALDRSTASVGGVTASGSLQTRPLDSTADAAAVIDRVSVEPLANGTAVRVVVRNVTLTARRGATTVATRRVNYSVAVAVPVLAMHQRTRAYERRLNRSPLEGPGLGRALTWRLWAVAQARGTAQHYGAPITNVLANRHVELSTNAAALRAQGAVYGQSDPAGRAALLRATGRVAATDLLTPATTRGGAWTRQVLTATERTTRGGTETPRPSTAAQIGSSSDVFEVGVNATADRAFLAVVDGTAGGGVDAAIEGAYRATATRRTSVLSTTSSTLPEPDPPGPNWTLASSTMEREVAVVSRESRRTPGAATVADERRTVEVRNRATRRWTRGGRVRETTAVAVDRYRVRVVVEVTHAPRAPSPVSPAPTEPVFVSGGAVDGANLADVIDRVERTMADDGTADRAALRAVRRGSHVDRTNVTGEPSDQVRAWVARDLASLRERVRNVSVTVSRDAVAAGEANAPARLAAALRHRRANLVDAPETYDGVADRARVAARAAYVDAVIRALEERADGADRRNDAYLDGVGDLRAGVDGGLDDLARIAAEGTAPEPSAVGRWRAGSVTFTPTGTPGYLPVTSVGADHVATLGPNESGTPLVARNTNLFAVPTGDAADSVTDAVLPSRRTASLAEAGRVLVAGDAVPSANGDVDRSSRQQLRRRVAGELGVIDRRAHIVLAERTSLSASERRRVVDETNSKWPHPGHRVAAVVNGSYAAVLARSAATVGDRSAVERDRLTVRLRVELAAAATDASVAVPADVRAGAVDETRRERRAVLRKAVESAGENATARLHRKYGKGKLGPVLAGVPVAPVPGYWYATANVWDVEVAGAYPRFALTAPAATGPDGADGRVRYVRDGSTVTLDVDDDGTGERLGRNERVSFRTWTVVVVVVPAGPAGVGDVDGNADERSSGWPCPWSVGAERAPSDRADCRTAPPE
ncbi:DUF7286 family protein [Halobaculum marinum]|uniref:Uncharacterized protein n=1 Tax=Halobaculum marinum TaxID=3031996 RepID=A0ABD5WYF4_9EURY|nr:hypothetical protein [Halobaculum sp. DT55]